MTARGNDEEDTMAASSGALRHVTFDSVVEHDTPSNFEGSAAADGLVDAPRLGQGHVRMDSEQIAAWAAEDLTVASVHRSTEQVLEQEATWKTEVNLEGRMNWSVREAVRLHANRFQACVYDFTIARMMARGVAQPASLLWQMPAPSVAHIADAAIGLGSVVDWVGGWSKRPSRSGATVRVAVRKRPILSFENERSEWDCVEANALEASVLCHDGRMARSGKELTLVHRRYLLDQVWTESASQDEVSRDAVLPLLGWSRKGRNATLLCYGQTGTGKTYTLAGALDFLIAQFDQCKEEAEAQFFEVRGQKLHDLFNNRAEVLLRADSEGHFHLQGAVRLPIGHGHGGADAMRATFERAFQLRCSEATERNAQSSRSHAVLVMWLKASGGMLRFVDLAGSERNYETEQMTAAQHRESAEINASLMALKDCFRAHAALSRGEKARPPYRASRLTQCLRDCFEDFSHRFLLIATVSPASSDVIHTGNTLRHAVMMARALDDAKGELSVSLALGSGQVASRNVQISEWTAEEVVDWAATVERGRFAQLVLPPGLNGEGLLALSAQGLASMFERDMRTGRGDGEGMSWNVTGYEEGQGSGVVLGRALFAAVRREAIAANARIRAASFRLGLFGGS